MAQKKYASLTTLQNMVDNIKNLFVKKDELNKTLEGYDTKGSAKAVQDNLNTLNDTVDSHTSNTNLHFSAGERTKLTGIEPGAQVNTVLGVKGNSESTYRTGEINITKANIGLGNVDNTSDVNKPVSTAQQTAIDNALNAAKTYADNKTSSLASTASVTAAIAAHNIATDAHGDITSAITTLTNRLNAVANSEDVNLDQLKEIVAYIKNNKSLIDGVTTSKVNVADIINNLTSTTTNKPLSAAQGAALKGLIDALTTALNTHDTNTTVHITAPERTKWNAASDTANQAKEDIVTINDELGEIRDNYLPLAGGTVTGTTVFSHKGTGDDSVYGDSYGSPSVVIGGAPEEAHLELDNNEIQAKGSKTTTGNLFLNSHGGEVHIGADGLSVGIDANGVDGAGLRLNGDGITPETALKGSIGTTDLPFDKMYSRFYYLRGGSGDSTEYGNFRVATGTATKEGTTTLQVGNDKATGTAHNSSGKITIYGSGTGFTNILASRTSGSNAVKLPTGAGTLALEETSTKALTMTNAEYKALTTEEINANTLYMITDEEDEQYVEQNAFDETIAGLNETMKLKVEKSEIEGLSGAISSKADQSYVDDLVASVSDKAVVEFITWGEGDTWEQIYGNNSGENGDSGEVTS